MYSRIHASGFQRSQAADWQVWKGPYLSPHRHFVIKRKKEKKKQKKTQGWLTGKMGSGIARLCKGTKWTWAWPFWLLLYHPKLPDPQTVMWHRSRLLEYNRTWEDRFFNTMASISLLRLFLQSVTEYHRVLLNDMSSSSYGNDTPRNGATPRLNRWLGLCVAEWRQQGPRVGLVRSV